MAANKSEPTELQFEFSDEEQLASVTEVKDKPNVLESHTEVKNQPSLFLRRTTTYGALGNALFANQTAQPTVQVNATTEKVFSKDPIGVAEKANPETPKAVPFRQSPKTIVHGFKILPSNISPQVTGPTKSPSPKLTSPTTSSRNQSPFSAFQPAAVATTSSRNQSPFSAFQPTRVATANTINEEKVDTTMAVGFQPYRQHRAVQITDSRLSERSIFSGQMNQSRVIQTPTFTDSSSSAACVANSLEELQFPFEELQFPFSK